MRVVWKYSLGVFNDHKLEIPAGYTFLHVAEQAGDVCVWALVDPDQPAVLVSIRIVGTGHRELRGDEAYIGTAHLFGGSLVLHVFQVMTA